MPKICVFNTISKQISKPYGNDLKIMLNKRIALFAKLIKY